MKLHLQATPQVLQQTIWCKKQWHSYYSRLHELRFGQTQDKHISNQPSGAHECLVPAGGGLRTVVSLCNI